jgi:hypothetical protein
MQAGTALADWQVAWLKAVARSWKDTKFRDELIADPRAALTQVGFVLPTCWHLVVSGGTTVPAPDEHTSIIHMFLPPKPATGDEAVALAEVSSYVAGCCCGQPCC